MSITIKLLWVILGIALLVGVVALSMWGVPAPKAEVRKILTYDQLMRETSR